MSIVYVAHNRIEFLIKTYNTLIWRIQNNFPMIFLNNLGQNTNTKIDVFKIQGPCLFLIKTDTWARMLKKWHNKHLATAGKSKEVWGSRYFSEHLHRSYTRTRKQLRTQCDNAAHKVVKFNRCKTNLNFAKVTHISLDLFALFLRIRCI